jgi:hypothetical protein
MTSKTRATISIEYEARPGLPKEIAEQPVTELHETVRRVLEGPLPQGRERGIIVPGTVKIAVTHTQNVLAD